MRLKTFLYTLCLRWYRAVSFDIFDTLLERDVDRPVDHQQVCQHCIR